VDITNHVRNIMGPIRVARFVRRFDPVQQAVNNRTCHRTTRAQRNERAANKIRSIANCDFPNATHSQYSSNNECTNATFTRKRRTRQTAAVRVRVGCLFVLDLELDIVVNEVVHGLAIGRLEDELALLHNVSDDHDELLV